MKKAVIAAHAAEGVWLDSGRSLALGAQSKIDMLCAGDVQVMGFRKS